ncbi:MAG: hypothetical protein WAN60_15360, partial [Candidatus Sulfotelmatobacter sp.]
MREEKQFTTEAQRHRENRGFDKSMLVGITRCCGFSVTLCLYGEKRFVQAEGRKPIAEMRYHG